MKTKLFLAVVLITAYLNKTSAQCTDVVNIPDANFKKALLKNYNINKNKDNEIQCSEARGYKGKIIVYNKNISDLTGIEEFVNLTHLECYGNNLTTLDISKNTKLTKLWCGYNKLTALDVSKNTKLTKLYCNNNTLTTLDVSKNTNLVGLYCHSNNLTSLDVSKNTNLTGLDCGKNDLTTLNVSKNTKLTGLWCYGNKLTSLGVSKNTKLADLHCYSNNLTTLDVSKNINLMTLYCRSNKLTALDVSKNTNLTELLCYGNKLTSLDVSKNTMLERLDCSYNSKLTCIKIKENFTPPSNSNWHKPTNAVWSANCATASISNETFTSGITIYPNPANDIISVNSNIKLSRVDIFTLLGRNVVSSSKEKINISSLNSGLYVVRIIDVDNKITTKK